MNEKAHADNSKGNKQTIMIARVYTVDPGDPRYKRMPEIISQLALVNRGVASAMLNGWVGISDPHIIDDINSHGIKLLDKWVNV